jgi:adenylyltransferase/sulfurtransferase
VNYYAGEDLFLIEYAMSPGEKQFDNAAISCIFGERRVSSSLHERELSRYSRQILLFGEVGQQRLKDATVFIAGAGGLGCPVALYLAAAGIGEIRIADRDEVELTNLNRQVLHREQDISRKKTDSALEKLLDLNSEISIRAFGVEICEQNALELVGDADLIIDALDTFEARYLLNRIAVQGGIPLIHGAIRGFEGQATTIIPGKTPCFRCIFPHPPPPEICPVIGVTAGIIGSIQANEAVKYLLGMDGLLAGRLLIWNGACTEMETIPVERDPACPDCGSGR